MCKIIKKFLREEAGATAVEYGLIAALVSVAAVTALTNVGDSLSTLFGNVSSDVNAATTP